MYKNATENLIQTNMYRFMLSAIKFALFNFVQIFNVHWQGNYNETVRYHSLRSLAFILLQLIIN